MPNEPKKIIIQGEEFMASQPYSEGHVLTLVEARALNQLRHENLRNNFASKVKAAAEGKEGALTRDQLASEFAKYDAEYTFAMPGQAARSLDPVEREARAIARTILGEQLKKEGRGRKLKDIAEDKLEAAIEKISAQDAVLKLARANVANRKKVVDSVSAELGLDLEEAEAEAEPEVEEADEAAAAE